MESKTKQCQNCKNKFIIEPEDFEFYKKIGVPEPTFCPECRTQRRMVYWNDLSVYMRKEDLNGKKVFSEFSDQAPIKVYDFKDWESDKWDGLNYGRDYDFNKSFFEQLYELMLEVPFPSRVVTDLVNCDYCKNCNNVKNGYLLISCVGTENSSYCFRTYDSKDSYDCMYLKKSELCYEGFMLTNCYKVIHSSHCESSQNLYFCHNCINCQNCFGCTNLKHKKYHIFNKQYTKEEYEEKIKEFNLGSYKDIVKLLIESNNHHLKYPRKFVFGKQNNNVKGDYIYNSKDAIDCYSINKGENLKYCQFLDTGGAQNAYDQTGYGLDIQHMYECNGCGKGSNNIKFTWHCLINCFDLEYCIESRSINNCFGCVGLKKKQYCILNKQYTKEEYEELVPKIKEHMNDMPYIDKKGNVYKYGEFFPSELSPFAYNETIANEYFPLTKEQSLERGYRWHNKVKSSYKPTILSKDLSDNIKDIDESILKEVIECENKDCQGSGVFKIIPQELKFYKKQNIPIPRLCPDCRHQQRIKQRNPMKLWERECMKEGCNTKFQTTYAPDRKEIVYCESCYQKEIE